MNTHRHRNTAKVDRGMTVVGLMSGTSGDGIDAAVVRISGAGHDLHAKLLAFRAYPYPRNMQGRILAASVNGTVADVCRLNAVLGEWFSRASLRIIKEAGLVPSKIDVIGSHGQTIHHLPNPEPEAGLGRLRSTLQIAEPSIIAERTGITTVADFRPRDMAAGGQGAPLTPYAHYVLLRHPSRSRLIVNLGGIGNVTYLQAGRDLSAVRAFDTGPGNMILDALMLRLSGGRQIMDRGGRMASRGTVDGTLLKAFLTHPYLRRRPPKSTGREEFGEKFLAEVLSETRSRRPEDLLATASFFTAATVGGARRWLPGPVDEVIVGGGGARNVTLMAHLADVFQPTPVRRFEDVGWDSKAFEAVAFAVLAYQTVRGECANVPSVTGASQAVLLGKLVPGRAGFRRLY
jgi:anhydro-N-acetylmuramic acid kinase